MGNEGFKGDRVFIDHISVNPGAAGGAATLQCGVQFVAEDGTVHAIAKHNFLLDMEVDNDGLAVLVQDLLQRITKKVESTHFTRPNDAENQVLKGIAETLRSTPTTSDEPGTQG